MGFGNRDGESPGNSENKKNIKRQEKIEKAHKSLRDKVSDFITYCNDVGNKSDELKGVGNFVGNTDVRLKKEYEELQVKVNIMLNEQYGLVAEIQSWRIETGDTRFSHLTNQVKDTCEVANNKFNNLKRELRLF